MDIAVHAFLPDGQWVRVGHAMTPEGMKPTGKVYEPHHKGGGEVSALDTQEGGDHYKKMGQYQPWEVLEKWLTPEELKGFMKGTVISYLAREADKGGDQDIRKAQHTMELYHELIGQPKGERFSCKPAALMPERDEE